MLMTVPETMLLLEGSLYKTKEDRIQIIQIENTIMHWETQENGFISFINGTQYTPSSGK